MKRKTAILLVFGLVAAYVGSYLFYSRDGLYVPVTWGAGKGGIQSKRMEKVWNPFGFRGSDPDRQVLLRTRTIVYLPLILLDRLVWHRKQPETADSPYEDYY